eukprot:5457307-Pleurochrysis_carterae.AAC.1
MPVKFKDLVVNVPDPSIPEPASSILLRLRQHILVRNPRGGPRALRFACIRILLAPSFDLNMYMLGPRSYCFPGAIGASL